jgi:hypothetical protein
MCLFFYDMILREVIHYTEFAHKKYFNLKLATSHS